LYFNSRKARSWDEDGIKFFSEIATRCEDAAGDFCAMSEMGMDLKKAGLHWCGKDW
jgi:hypothetical protein